MAICGQYNRFANETGSSVLELLVALSITGVLLGIAAMNARMFESPAVEGAAHLTAFFKQARAKAMSTTQAYTITAASPTQIIAEYADTCADTVRTADSQLVLNLPDTAVMSSMTWSICYSTRGISDDSATITVTDPNVNRTLLVAAGGGVKIL